MSETRAPAAAPSYFVTGFPGFIGKRLVTHLAEAEPRAHLALLVQPRHLKEAQRLVKGLENPGRVELLTGDVADMHLGLSGEEYERLRGRTTDIFHLAALTSLSTPKETAWRVNVDGTRNVLELARDCGGLRRFNHLSTCYVSGDRVGVIAEDELDRGQAFRNAYEETKFHAERLVQRAGASLPVTIFRPGSVVGDSRTGEIDRFDGPYYLGILLVTSPLVAPLPLPGNGVAPLNVIPMDYLVEAVWTLSRDPAAVGQTFHLVDPNPMSARRVYELVAERANRKLPRFNLSARAADVMLRLPVLERLARPQRAAISYVSHLALYNCHNTLERLEGTSVRCPPLLSYLDPLVDYVRGQYEKRREQALEVEDPLDSPLPSPAGDDTDGGRSRRH
ncbi:SDR family oxidoreductase [Aggregicoccus sp. 17bor-14]|uniref:SDR family oxidoreductase n=1 Tax=Myxococcaceae TaxID=31 RepID=UPI00129CD6B0|nr:MULTISPECIES: SDR family oxidoreductase [Myxococcaceae]MBF5041220.1 SDR family oxidoreductase [Simulacricoccus sp. 17bor-14]MRI87007.1 SDR family oxidoreductase [Aggregicoccus sp. 17bor-14]